MRQRSFAAKAANAANARVGGNNFQKMFIINRLQSKMRGLPLLILFFEAAAIRPEKP
jgi:hypothetical protein